MVNHDCKEVFTLVSYDNLPRILELLGDVLESLRAANMTISSDIKWRRFQSLDFGIGIELGYVFLVGGLEHVLFSHSVGNVIIPVDELIFFRGVGQPPTSLDLDFVRIF